MRLILRMRKIRIVPTPEQEQVLGALSEKCRLLYGFALAKQRQHWETNRIQPKKERTTITFTHQQKASPLLNKQNPDYTWIYSKVLQMTLRCLHAEVVKRNL